MITWNSTGSEFQNVCSINSVRSSSNVALQDQRAEVRLDLDTVSTSLSPSSPNSSSNFEELIAALKTPPTTPPPVDLTKIEQRSIADNAIEKLIIMDDLNEVIESVTDETAVGAVSLTTLFVENENAKNVNSEAESIGEIIEITSSQVTHSFSEELAGQESIVHCMK